MKFLFRSLLALVAATLMLSACGGAAATSADLEFTDVWTRQPAEGQGVGAVYGTVTNTGGSDVTITGASVEVTDRAELHEVVDQGGLMTMRETEGGIVIPAGGTVNLEPGGYHVMLFDIDAATYPSDALDVTFSFDAGPDTFASAQVRQIEGAMDDMDDMDHSDHSDSGHGGDAEMDDMEMDETSG